MAPLHRRVLLGQRSHVVDASLMICLRCLALLGAYCELQPALAADVPLGNGVRAHFADTRDGVAALTQRDVFLEELSPFDYQVRLKTDRPVGQADLLAHIPQHVVPWPPDEIAKLTPILEDIGRKLAPWKLPLPADILLVKTDGNEDANAAYCRGAAIALPQRIIAGPRASLEKLLPHELFHVLSSHNPKLRQALYATIGFQGCNEVLLPEPLRPRKITNPDAPVNDQYITVNHNGQRLELMPVLYSKSEHYDPARGGTLFSYLTFKLMALANENGTRVPLLVGGQPQMYDAAQVPGFYDQVGRNTDYIIHPEEILADNFVFLINGRVNLPTPRIVEAMGSVLQAGQPASREPALVK